MVDAMDLKSIEDKTSCEFESRPGHFLLQKKNFYYLIKKYLENLI